MKYIIILLFTVSAFSQQKLAGKLENNVYTSIDGMVSFPLPANLGSDPIRDRADPQGITNQVMISAKDGNLFGLTTTKTRNEFPKNDNILYRTAARYRQQIKAEDGSTLEFIDFIKAEKRSILITIVRHIERGMPATLKDKWLNKSISVNADALEARLYISYKGYFIEFKRIIVLKDPLNTGEKNEDQIAKAAFKKLFNFVSSSNTLNELEKNKLSQYDLNQTIIRGIYKDPSLEK